jgi:Tfp pilus assembly protein PilN
MNSDDPEFAALDARMRRMMAGLDAGAGFEARVMQRVTAKAARAGAIRTDLQAQFERRREIVRRRLRREAWSYAITIAGVGVAAFALVWRYSAQIVQWVTASDLLATSGPASLIAIALAAVCAALWPFRRRLSAS